MATATLPVESKAEQLAAKTQFLIVRFGGIGNSKKVNAEESEQILETDADKDSLRVSKMLLDSKELKAVRQSDSALRAWVRDGVCLPFEANCYLLPLSMKQDVLAKLIEHRTNREALVEVLIAAYPALLEEAQKRLGPLFVSSDYPESLQKLKSYFTFSWLFVTMTDQDKQDAMLQEAQENITLVMRQTLLEMVTHLSDRLRPDANGKTKKLHATAVTKLQEFLETFEKRNVAGDLDLSEQVKKAKALIAGTNVDALRNSEEFKTKVLAGMANIGQSLTGLVEEQATRKFRLE